MSSDEKGAESSIDSQQKIIESFLRQNPDITLHKTFVDQGVSSFARIRPSFEEMLLDVENGSINCIITKDISRFSRDYLEAGYLLQKQFPRWGVRFISVSDDFDSLKSDVTQLGFVLKTLFAFTYSQDISRKIQAAIQVNQKAGKYVPAKLPYGYKKVHVAKAVEWQPNEETAPIVQSIFDQALAGYSAYAIANKLNGQQITAPGGGYWSARSVVRILRNIAYTGTFLMGKTRNNLTAYPRAIPLPKEEWVQHKFHHTPVVDDIKFYSVQQLLARRSSPMKKRVSNDDFFAGKLYCGVCGRKMRMKHSTNGNVYYICARRDESSVACANKAIIEKKVKKLVLQQIREKLQVLRAEYVATVEFETSPYFKHREQEQAKLLAEYEAELQRQRELMAVVFEASVTNRHWHRTDSRELLRHLAQVRAMLEEKIADIVAAKEYYLQHESSVADRFKVLYKYGESEVLTEGMVGELIEKIWFFCTTCSISWR